MIREIPREMLVFPDFYGYRPQRPDYLSAILLIVVYFGSVLFVLGLLDASASCP